MLLAAGYEPPRQLFVHGYLNIDQQKISKSLGNAIDPLDLIDVYGADAVRFWCARQVSFGQDGNVSLDSFGERYDRELANDLGNLVSRTTAMIARYRGGRLQRTPAQGAFDAAALREAIVEQFDRYDITGALDSIWQAVRALNQYVESSAPGSSRRTSRVPRARRGPLRPRRRDRRSRGRARAVPARDRARASSTRFGQSGDLSLERVAVGVAEAPRGSSARAALPAGRSARARCVIDTHAHLDALDDRGRAVRRAREAGSRASSPSARRSKAAGRARARRPSRRCLRDPRHPSARGGRPTTARRRASPSCSSTRGWRVGETGLDYFRDYAPRRSAAAVRALLGVAASAGSPWSSTRGPPTTTRWTSLAGFDGTVVLHCFSSSGLLPRRSSAATTSRSPATSAIRRRAELRIAAARIPADRLLAETDSPYLSPQPVRGRPNEPANVVHTLAALAEARGEDTDPARGADRRERERAVRTTGMSVRPRKDLGQHFLVDENILGVIGRLATWGRTTSSSRSAPGSVSSRATSPTASRSSTPSRSTARSFRTSHSSRTSASRSAMRCGSTLQPRPSSRASSCEPALQRRDADRGREPRRSSLARSAGA
jgi:Tat protein secretion system quality control protein TatD with DNase activity